MNRVILMGRLAKDPDVRTTKSGKMFARMTIAVDRFGKDKGADFINLLAWEKTAEFAGKYLAKGRKILVEGHIQTGSYEAEDGSKRYTFDVGVDRMEFCDSKGTSAKNAQVDEPFTVTDDDIPF